jgi:glutamine amidotransferase
MIAIIEYGEGNTCSVQHALNRLGVPSVITGNPESLRSADKVIFPGVGHAAAAMEYLQNNKLDTVIRELRQPVLGICLGMQLLCRSTEEGNCKGLGIFDTGVKRFRSAEQKVPHVGWNTVKPSVGEGQGGDEDFFYFVHSYYASCCNDTVAVTDYILPFSAVLRKDNFYGAQFHPEKSGKTGEQFLLNFLKS